MSKYKKHRRISIAEIRPYIVGEMLSDRVSISPADKDNGSPKHGDVIARNPDNHDDMWLINEKYYKANFELIEE